MAGQLERGPGKELMKNSLIDYVMRPALSVLIAPINIFINFKKHFFFIDEWVYVWQS